MLIEFHGFLPGRGQYPEIYSDWPKMLDGQMKQYVDKMVHGLLNTNEHLVLAWAVYSWFLYGDEIGTQGPRESSPTNTWRKGLPGSEKICHSRLQVFGWCTTAALRISRISLPSILQAETNTLVRQKIGYPKCSDSSSVSHILSLGIAVFGYFWSISLYSPSISG